MKSKAEKRTHFDHIAAERAAWRARNAYYYEALEAFIASIIPAGRSVLELGSGTGELLARLAPSRGLGIDLSAEMVRRARERWCPANACLEFSVDDIETFSRAEIFDYVILSDTIGDLTDIWAAFRNLRQVLGPESRLVITYFNGLWEPVLRLGERLGMKMPQDDQNWLDLDDIVNLLRLNGIEVVRRGLLLPLPVRVPWLAAFANRFAGRLPLLEQLGLVTYLIARAAALPAAEDHRRSVSIVVPCRNERGNIRPAIARIPRMGSHTEIIFVDGNSTDGTIEEIEAARADPKCACDIRVIHQVPADSHDGAGHGKMLGLGKGDAVRKGFAAARGDILMILDADLTVPPEELPRFYSALVEGHGEFVNGSRLVYPMEREAMRFLNRIANRVFGALFSWLLEQPVRDTLCGTKALLRSDYETIARERGFFGDFDPFGDFDLLFGAARLHLKIVEVPVRYRERTYGETKIRRFKHGLLLLKMCWIAAQKFKFLPWPKA